MTMETSSSRYWFVPFYKEVDGLSPYRQHHHLHELYASKKVTADDQKYKNIIKNALKSCKLKEPSQEQVYEKIATNQIITLLWKKIEIKANSTASDCEYGIAVDLEWFPKETKPGSNWEEISEERFQRSECINL